jgi:3-isopropylmalate/(R)-2-methylmalate dehydratase large subunit
VRRPEGLVATTDHYVPTGPGGEAQANPEIRGMVENPVRSTREEGVTLFGPGDPRMGIVHVIGPEQGLTQPGLTLVCGDSHTATHGALGTLAFGIGSSEVEHVLATQCLWQRKPKVMRVSVTGTRARHRGQGRDPGHHRPDRRGGGVGHAIEYAGPVIAGMTMDERLTVCNMSIEAGARAAWWPRTRRRIATGRAGPTRRRARSGRRQKAADFLEAQDIFAAPVLSIDGELIAGFRRERIDALLGLGGP